MLSEDFVKRIVISVRLMLPSTNCGSGGGEGAAREKWWTSQTQRSCNRLEIKMTKKVGKASFHMFINIAFFNLLDNSLRKQPTFSDATNDFPAKWRLRKEGRIFVTTQMRVAFLIGWKFTSTNHKYYLLLEIFGWGHFHIIFNNDNDDGTRTFIMKRHWGNVRTSCGNGRLRRRETFVRHNKI